jgi:hypothetical protein
MKSLAELCKLEVARPISEKVFSGMPASRTLARKEATGTMHNSRANGLPAIWSSFAKSWRRFLKKKLERHKA